MARALASIQNPLPKSSINPNDPVDVLRAVSGELDRMQALVNKEVGQYILLEGLNLQSTSWIDVGFVQSKQVCR